MKVLVTGAGGFVGRHIIPILLNQNHEVVIASSNPDNLKKFEWFPHVSISAFNLNDLAQNLNYFDFFGKPDLLIHLAWEGLPNYQSAFHIDNQYPNQKLFLKNIIDGGLKNLAVTGTCYEYGLKEGRLSEDDICVPQTQYGTAKWKLYTWLDSYCNLNQVVFKWLRLFYLFGNGQNSNSLYSQMSEAFDKKQPIFYMSKGDQQRDFLNIQDAAGFIVKVSIKSLKSEVINICSGKPTKVIDFVQQFFKSKDYIIVLDTTKYNYPAYEPFKFWGNNQKLNTIINE